MRTLTAAIVLAAAAIAAADSVPPWYWLGYAFEHHTLDKVLANPVELKGVVFGSKACADRLGTLHHVKGADVVTLARCLEAESPTRWLPGIFQPTSQVVVETQVGSSLHVLLDLTTTDNKVIAITGYATYAQNGAEATLPTYVADSPIAFTPSDKTKAALTAAGRTVAIAKLCHDARGTVTSRRIVGSDAVPALGAEYLAALEHVTKVDVPTVLDAPLAGCQVIRLTYP